MALTPSRTRSGTCAGKNIANIAKTIAIATAIEIAITIPYAKAKAIAIGMA